MHGGVVEDGAMMSILCAPHYTVHVPVPVYYTR